jgi:hypothetical protein
MSSGSQFDKLYHQLINVCSTWFERFFALVLGTRQFTFASEYLFLERGYRINIPFFWNVSRSAEVTISELVFQCLFVCVCLVKPLLFGILVQ